MFDELNYIELSGKRYPIKCDLLVLEKIQDAYGSIGKFEEGLITWEPEVDDEGNTQKDADGKPILHGKFPSVKAVNDALVWMASEGEAIAADQEKRKPRAIIRAEIVREVDVPLIDLANKLHDEFYRCFNLKNAVATQNQT
ncbi:hypothetical protein EAI89_06790 [Eubacterium sp. am_0171]|uniref:Uncharacterized protein n=1 Tax=Faecalicatena contorta TaxID=39482 RepID=A0A174CPB7_9FIRM|nr:MULTISPECIES: hypothetical protein [Clostridia]MSC84354.1 hypothetical protein [Eubacterium sp. BIOML-A1]MSD05900.1 hypothetical protein [Eubacterium sp. BIOML-A2]RYT23270.1 hypothetical protein EAI89_06790 [Eubacterium sp. am_0171]CUO13555.1 Uncharacterised protein [[Eubacterium] contortum] [Faecalicatena contorta]